METRSHRHVTRRGVFFLVAIVLVGCVYSTARRGCAEWLYGGANDLRRVRMGCELEPADPECALIRAQLTDKLPEAATAWDQAVRLSPRSMDVLAEAAVVREMNGDPGDAERLLLQAESANHLWLPRWSLANFYLRQGRPADTLKWVRLALTRAYGDRRAAFRLCRQAGASDQVILNDILAADDPENLSAFLNWITEEDRLDTLEQAVPRYVDATLHGKHVDPAASPAVIVSGVVETLLEKNHPAEAHGLWTRLLSEHKLPIVGASTHQALTNPSFAPAIPGAPCFDWRIPEYAGIEVTRGVPADGIRFALTGDQPESAELLIQAVDLGASRRWTLDYEYQTRDITSERHRLEWSLIPWGNTVLVPADHPAGKAGAGPDGWTHESVSWTIPESIRFFRLGFGVRRILGHIRIQGEIQLRNLRLAPEEPGTGSSR